MKDTNCGADWIRNLVVTKLPSYPCNETRIGFRQSHSTLLTKSTSSPLATNICNFTLLKSIPEVTLTIVSPSGAISSGVNNLLPNFTPTI